MFYNLKTVEERITLFFHSVWCHDNQLKCKRLSRQQLFGTWCLFDWFLCIICSVVKACWIKNFNCLFHQIQINFWIYLIFIWIFPVASGLPREQLLRYLFYKWSCKWDLCHKHLTIMINLLFCVKQENIIFCISNYNA